MKKSILFLGLSLSFLAIWSCNKDDDSSNNNIRNEFKLGDDTYAMERAAIFYFGEWDGVYEYEMVFQKGLTLNSEGEFSGTGDVVFFEIETTRERLPASGTYSMDINNDLFIFEGMFAKGLSIDPFSFEEMWDMISGSFNLTFPEEGIIRLEGNMGFRKNAQDPNTTGKLTYSGAFDFVDESDFLVGNPNNNDKETRRAEYRKLISEEFGQ